MSARLSGYYFLSFAFVGVFAPYFALYLHDAGSSARDIAILMAVMQSMRLFGPYLWGTAVDKGLPPKQAIGLTALGGACGLLAFMLGEGFAGMLLGMTILALFWNGAPALLETLTFDHLRERATHYGPIRTWGSLGFVAAVLAMGQLLERHSTGIVPWACWVILLGLLLLSFALPDAPCRPRAATSMPVFKTMLAKPVVAATLAAGFLMAAAHGALNVFYTIHLSQHGYGASAIGILWALGVAAEIAIFMAMPRLDRLFAPRLLLAACFAAAIVRFTLIGWWVSSIFVAVFAQLLHALSFGAHHTVSVSAVNRGFASGNHAKGQALYASCYGAGTLAGGLASGFLWAPLGSSWTFGIGSIFAFAGMVVIMLFMYEEKK